MKKLIVSLLIIILGFILVDRVAGRMMWWVNQHSNDTIAPKIKYITSGVSEDVVLMGTSRCQGHYVSSIIRDSIGMSVYNGGIDASENIYSHYILLSHLLEKCKPKVICLDVRLNDILTEKTPFMAISFFAPYYGRNSRADSVYQLARNAWGYEVSHLYRFNSKAPSNILGLISNKQSIKGADNGYLPIAKPARPLTIPNKELALDSRPVDKNKVEYLKRFASLCKQNDIQLVFVVSPMPTYVDKDYYKCLKSFAVNHGIVFLDYHTTGLFLDHPEYFKDRQHLWDEGAREFSKVFGHDLKRVVSND